MIGSSPFGQGNTNVIDFGITSDEFRKACFEQEPKHFAGALTERPFTWSSLDRLLHAIDPSEPTIRMFHHGQLPEHAYTEDFVEVGKQRRKLNKANFYELMQRGATLQINWLERHSVEARRLCLEIGRFAGTQTSGNAYMSFSGDGTFGEHWDTHDVFAIQLIGRKRWRIFPPTFPLPLTYQTHDRSGHKCPTQAALELTMEEGDVLYLPRGWWHHVIPLEVGSFHFSVGCYAPTLFDYIVQTSAKYLEQHEGARRSFSPSDYRETVANALKELESVLADQNNADAFERDWVGRERMNAEFNLASLDSAATPLRGDTCVSLAGSHPPRLEGGVLFVNGGHAQLEPVSQAIISALSDAVMLRLDELSSRLQPAEPETVRRAVMDLARHDVVTIQS